MRLEVDNKRKKTKDVAPRCAVACTRRRADAISYVINEKQEKYGVLRLLHRASAACCMAS
eukprot:scaffold411978_cov37-Prasinocladus_malaysianus.AAC.1